MMYGGCELARDILDENKSIDFNFGHSIFIIINELQTHRPLLASTNRSYYIFK